MNSYRHIENIVSILLFLGLFLSLFFIYFAQERLYINTTTGVNVLGPERYLRILSVITIFSTVIVSLFISKKKYHHSIFIAYLTLIISVTLNYVISGADFFDTTQIMDKKGIGTWICLGLIFTSYHNNRYALFNKFLFFSVFFISLLSVYNFIDFGIGLWRGQALSKYRVYAVNMVWIAPYVFLILKHNKKLKWLRILSIVFGTILALVIQTRSFLIIYFITLVFDFYNTKNKIGYLVISAIGFLGFLYLVLNTNMLSSSLELLINRGTNDTRTEQIKVFVSQLDFFEVITGKGFYASYRWGYGEASAIDNQWLYLLWWGGIIPLLSYAYLCVAIPIKFILKGNLSYESKVECFILILWFLALTGLAIFTTMTIDFFFFIICIILGRVLYKYSINKK